MILPIARTLRSHASASIYARLLVSCLLGFWGVDRKSFRRQERSLNLREFGSERNCAVTVSIREHHSWARAISINCLGN